MRMENVFTLIAGMYKQCVHPRSFCPKPNHPNSHCSQYDARRNHRTTPSTLLWGHLSSWYLFWIACCNHPL